MTDPVPAPASDYDEFVDWGKRLAREMPFFEREFAAIGARSVIDVGAGSARHAIAFAERGMAVDAIDPDPSMLARAESNVAAAAERIAEKGGQLRLLKGGFGELKTLGLGPADALVCTGNALPHVEGHAGLVEALADFAAVLRPGGIVVLHLLNHARLLTKRPEVIPPVIRRTPEGTKVFLRVVDYRPGDEFIDFDFVTLVRADSGDWQVSDRRSAHTALPAPLLQRALESAGFEAVGFLGGHDGHALTAEDESVIVTARRRV